MSCFFKTHNEKLSLFFGFLGLGIGSEILKNLSQVCLSEKSKQAELRTHGKAVFLLFC